MKSFKTSAMDNNIHPVFDQILNRAHKESLLKQRSKVIWLTGLSGSGKTTIAKGLEKTLFERGYLTQVLDGDNIRSGLNRNLKFSSEDRVENIRRIAEVSKLFMDCGIITINSFVSPTEELRHMARDIIGQDDFIEIFINAPIEVCEQRDVKGLYHKARTGEIKNFTGIDAPFEIPEDAGLVLDTSKYSAEESIQEVLEYVLQWVKHADND